MAVEDNIISHFKKQETLGKETLEGLIDRHLRNDDRDDISQQQRSQGLSEPIDTIVSREKTLESCEQLLAVYTDMIKLGFLVEKAWDLETMRKCALVRFNIETNSVFSVTQNPSNYGEDFYAEVAFKAISKCDKVSKGLEQLTRNLDAVSTYVHRIPSEQFLEDSNCLLLEMWFLCGKVSRNIKKRTAGTFMRAKLLLIDCDLDAMRSDSAVITQHITLNETITAYRNFMKILLQQLHSCELHDEQGQFEECLLVFMDVESMYAAMKTNYLLIENATPEPPFEEDEQMHALDTINKYVDDAVLEHKEPALANLHDDDRNTRRRLSVGSSTSDLSLMMERTSLSKELPQLLQAFNNAKNLGKELESIRCDNGTLNSLGSCSVLESNLSDSNSLAKSFKSDESSELSSTLLTKNIHIKTGKDNLKSDLSYTAFGKPQMPPFASRDKTAISPINVGLAQNRKIHGFGSNVLNNLYGLNTRD
ncbi:LAMI_0D09318g1_1 [Lachancea mirantina]|uniref:LAMI_0D09318g1_1 n=1 Tax=Lachancea mirantina TaxID=1230905 RepID=A0A1G4JDH4_9SACH|nr:LAMI_0D09318g1_1 [Lachancea mirantina]